MKSRDQLSILGLSVVLLGASVFLNISGRVTTMQLVWQAQNARALGQTDKAEELAQDNVDHAASKFGENSDKLADALEYQGDFFVEEGKLREAEDSFERALAIREKIETPGSEALMNTLERLGNVYLDRGKYKLAEDAYQRALTNAEIQSKNPKKDYVKILFGDLKETPDPALAQMLSHLGFLHSKMAEYDKAERYYRQALSIRETVLGPKHPAVSKTVNDLALVSTMMGKKFERGE